MFSNLAKMVFAYQLLNIFILSTSWTAFNIFHEIPPENVVVPRVSVAPRFSDFLLAFLLFLETFFYGPHVCLTIRLLIHFQHSMS